MQVNAFSQNPTKIKSKSLFVQVKRLQNMDLERYAGSLGQEANYF